MSIKLLFAKPYAKKVARSIKKSRDTAVADQKKILEELVKTGRKTIFGKEHGFDEVKDYESFKKHVPVRSYEELKPYVEQIKGGKHNVLWKGRPIYFAKTSGTTSGTKYIPITKDSIHNHINSARNAILCYIAETGNAQVVDGNMIFLSGSPVLERVGDIPTGRLSGIVNHHVPRYLRTNQLPSYETNCIEDWEEKIKNIVAETHDKNMTLISGIPPWMQMYFDELIAYSGKKIGELFPNFNLMIQGGVNFEPYKSRLLESIGREVDTIEVFPASEGFFAFQDSQTEEGLLLNTRSGIFFEFMPVATMNNANPVRLGLQDVVVGENYALVISSNAGLWAYNIGDTVKFVSTSPYRLLVTGRTKHFISAFGEHVIGEEVEYSINIAAQQHNARITEFTVAPYISDVQGKSFHEWFIEFEKIPDNMDEFALTLDKELCKKNSYYNDLITGKILDTLAVSVIKENGFIEFMKSEGKLGGQNKVARLSNNRVIADKLKEFTA